MTFARALLLPLTVLACMPPPAAAQELLTLEQAVDAALARNPALRAADAARREADAQARAARSAFFPRISFTESWQRGNAPGFVFSSLLSSRRFTAEHFAIDRLNHPDATGSFRASVGVEQIVFDIGRSAATGAAFASRDMAAAEVVNRAHALALATIETFGRVLTAQASAAAARTAIEAGRQDLERARHRRDAGLVTDADVLALVVHVADLERRRIQAEGDAAIARAELNRLMGSPIDRDFRVVEPSSSASERTRDLTALLAEAEASRPDLLRAAAAERLADFNRRAARAAVVPTVAAHAAFDASGLHLGERVSGWIAGVELRWSLSTGGAEIARLDASSRAVERARAESEDLRAAVRVDVVAALRRLEAAEARLAAGRAAVEQAREAERIVRDRYEAGIATVTDVLRAATAVLDAEANRASALVDGVVSSALLNRAIGRRPL